jgi:hypothetical protein
MKPIIRKRRTSERGAALVEAAVMMPLFITITFAGFYAYNYGRAGIDIKTSSRAEAWSLAMSNCGSSGSDDSEKLPEVEGSTEGASGGAANTTPITHTPPSASLSTQMHGALGGGGGGGAFIVTIIQGFFNWISPLFPNPTGSTSTQTETINYRIPYQGNMGPGFVSRSGSPTGTKAGGKGQGLTANVTLSCNQAPSSGDQPLGYLNAIAAAADLIVIAMAPSPNI